MVRIYLENMVPSDVSNAVRKTLADLHERGYKIALGSSSRKAKIILKKVALEEAFDAISDGTNISKSKPDPEVFLKAAEYGANALMVYTGAPQNTRRKEIKDLNLEAGLAYADKAGIKEIVIHAPYIINLGNMEKPEMFDFGVEFLAKEVKRAAAFHSKVLVLHPGSSLSAGVEASVEQIAKGLNLVLNADDSEVNIALETMAGKGSEVGRTFEELRMIYDKVDRKDRLRVCFDTCHVNDAGYDLVNDYEGVLAQFDKILGLDQIAVIHVNDSLNPLGAHKDRHANIGQGTIGYETLHRIVHDDRFTAVPKILETPWLCAEGGDKKTIPPYKQEIVWLKA